MKIAISSEENKGLDSQVSHHFGRCPYYVLLVVDCEEVQEVKTIANPFYSQHQPGQVPGFIHEQGVEVMISGGMGRRAIDFFDQYGIEVATGAEGTARSTLERFLKGELNDAQPCRESVEHQDHHH
jgi:predicted Fe-Mo cluster-binding NifX family protein